MVAMQREDFNHLHSTGLFLVGIVVRQHGVHVIGRLQAVIERVVATVGHTLVGCRSYGGRMGKWGGDSGYFPSLLVF